MNTAEITTHCDKPSLGLEATFTAGRVSHLSLRAQAGLDHVRYCNDLRLALSQGLAEHTAAILQAALEKYDSEQQDPHRAAALNFAQDQLKRAANAPRVPSPPSMFRRELPQQSDGRDQTGQVHVSINRNTLVILEMPQQVLDQPRLAGAALMEAINLALSRGEADSAQYFAGFGQPDDQLPSWAELADTAERLSGR